MDYIVLLIILVATCVEGPPSCRVSEFFCDTGQCVALDRYCDGEDDCGDKSDEPRYCSPCNRTYFGDIGRTYELEIRRPREDRLPFLCHLNFTAAGGDLGDLVQLTFDTFTVGKFVSFTSDGCPDGHMTIREQDRPPTGGQWCGSAWGYTVYYSESNSLNLTLQLYRMSEQGLGYNFDFKLAYKFLKKSEAHLRYGNSTLQPWRGDLVPGTYCDRVLDRCDARPCRVQSPNFPGVYPRNVTCYYRIEQRGVPRGKHALLAVRQRNTHKIHIKDQIVKYDRSQRVLKVWDQCNVIQDYLTVYDGASTIDPILVRLCGGDVVPDIVSSGPNMLLEFHTSAFDNPFHPVPLSYLPGFELEVQVIYVDARSNNYVHDSKHCGFTISSFDSPWGVLENPKHSLPPNTTCRYDFQGRRHETVWISFIKYYAANVDSPAYDSTECITRLRVWDGRTPSIGLPNNATLLGEFCKDEVPRLCDHTLLSNATRYTRPCSLAESYVSSSSELTLEQHLRQGSALYPFSFVLRYEFVDTTQEGSPNKDSDNPCDRVFTSTQAARSGRFHSPRSVFFYGRGGAQNISCTLRFEASQNERVRITFTRAKFGDRPCVSDIDVRTDRYHCSINKSRNWKNLGMKDGVAELWISEYPWPGIQIPRDCLCSSIDDPLTIRTLTSSVVEVNFTVTLMNITQDFNDFYFEGEYQFLHESERDEDGIELCPAKKEDRRLKKASGEIHLSSPYIRKRPQIDSMIIDTTDDNGFYDKEVTSSYCVNYPWLIEPEDSGNNFIYLKTYGFELPNNGAFNCPTLNRVIIYSGTDTRNPKVICPSGSLDMNEISTIEVFSDGWNKSESKTDSSILLLSPHARSFIVEFLEREYGNHIISWMEVSKRPLLTSSSSFIMSLTALDCPYRCPELNACISSALWCDGIRHCPSGFDEDEGNCAFQFGVPILYIFIIAGALGILIVLILITICVKYEQHRRNERKKKNQNSNNHLHVNHIHNSSDSYGLGLSGTYGGTSAVGLPISKRFPTSAHDDLYGLGHVGMGIDGKDSLC